MYRSMSVLKKTEYQLKHSRQLLTFQPNLATTRKQSTSSEQLNEDEFRLIYEGPLTRKVRFLKLFSLSTATISVIVLLY